MALKHPMHSDHGQIAIYIHSGSMKKQLHAHTSILCDRPHRPGDSCVLTCSPTIDSLYTTSNCTCWIKFISNSCLADQRCAIPPARSWNSISQCHFKAARYQCRLGSGITSHLALVLICIPPTHAPFHPPLVSCPQRVTHQNRNLETQLDVRQSHCIQTI
jgi:hypothetical protein